MEEREELEAARAAAIAAGLICTVGRLRDEFRMRPRQDAAPVCYYKRFRTRYPVYRITDCVPMRARSSAAPSERQLRAAALLALRAQLRSRLAAASSDAGELLAESPLFIDTETTGLDGLAQVIELAIVDAAGHTLLDTRVRPTVEIDAGAQAVHGIDAEALASAPAWPEIAQQVSAALVGRVVVAFNAEYDARLLRQTAAAHDDPATWRCDVDWRCAMDLSVDAFGATNDYGTISLANAMCAAGVPRAGRAHSALSDACAALDVVRAIAAVRPRLEAELRALQSA